MLGSFCFLGVDKPIYLVMELIMAITTNAFENYKNTIEASSKGGFLSKLKGFGIDSLGGLDSFMGKDIINANKLLKSFKGFDLNSILSNLGGFFKNLGLTALQMLKDMGMDALRQLENASINFVANLAEDFYNNVRSMMYIPDSSFAVTLKGLYLAGADLAYNNHYIRKSALQRDWAVSLEFIDEQYGIDYNLRDYKDLESDLSICANNSCVNNLYYIFNKMYDQLKELRNDIIVDESYLETYTTPIKEFKLITYDEAIKYATNHIQIYVNIGNEKVAIDVSEDSAQGPGFVRDHPNAEYYIYIITSYTGISDGLYKDFVYPSSETEELVKNRYLAYLDKVELANQTERLMLTYFKVLIVHGYTYLTATSVQKFFTDFNAVLLPKYYGATDDKYNKVYMFNQNDCLIMMPDYKGNDESKSDKYTQELAQLRNNQYIASEGAKSDAAKAMVEAANIKGAARSASERGTGPWSSESGYTVTSAVEYGKASATAKIKQFRANAMEKVAGNQNSSYTANIVNGITKTLDRTSNGLLNRSGKGINAKDDNKKIASMYDRDIVKNYELAGSISDKLDDIDFLNKDTEYIVLRNKNIKQIYALLSNSTLYGDNKMVNDYFYKRCKIKTMNTLNQSLSKAASIIGSTYGVQALFDLESAVDSSAYVYIKKVENFLLNPKEHSYNGLDTMFSSGDNMWTQFGDYFKQAYNWDDSVGDDPELEKMIETLANTKPSDSSADSTSGINPEADLSSENGANPVTYNEILDELAKNYEASTYVDNVVRFMSTIPALELRDILNKYLTLFYKGMVARDFKPASYFKTLIKSMSGISDISHYDDLNTKIFNRSTHKSLLANGKFLISIFALKNSYKYFLEDQKDSNKEELTKLYNLIFSMGAANIQMSGTISVISKYDREQLNSLVKQNFFASINHLKAINDKTKPLIATAPKYKDSLTTSFKNTFDLRGITGYSFENKKLLYVPEHGTGDWNSVGVSGEKEIGSFFCKSKINNGESGIYRRAADSGSLTKLTIKTSKGTIVTGREFYVITFENSGVVYFGLNDYSSKKETLTETLFVFDAENNQINGVSGFSDDPKKYDFKIDVNHNLFIITSKDNKGCYYSSIGAKSCSKLASSGSNHFFIKLGDNSLLVCPKNSKSGIGYFNATGQYINTCNFPNNVESVTAGRSATVSATIMIQSPAESSSESGNSSELPQPIQIPTPINIYGAIFSTNIGIIHMMAVPQVDLLTGNSSGTQLILGKTYSFADGNTPCYVFDSTVIGVKNSSKVIYRTLNSKESPLLLTMDSIINYNLFEFGSEQEAVNVTYKSESENQPNSTVKFVYGTDDGVYILLTRSEEETSDLYFVSKKTSNRYMYLIRNGIPIDVTSLEIISPNTSSNDKPNVIIHPNKSLDFVSILTTSAEIKPSILGSSFIDIDSLTPSEGSKIIKESNLKWENISVPNDNNIYIQNKKYGVILFGNSTGGIHEIFLYSNLTSGDIKKSDMVFDFNILKANGLTIIANKSSGNKYIKNGYGIFKSTDNGISKQYLNESAFHDGDISSMAYDKYNKCVYFCSYRDKTIFDYDYLATTAAFDIDSYISRLSYYELTKLAKLLIENQTLSTGEGILDLLAAKVNDEDNSEFKYTIEELMNGAFEMSVNMQQSSQASLTSSTLFTELANYKAATELFDDVESDEFNDDMTKDFIMSYPGIISTAPNKETEDLALPIKIVGDLNKDGVVNEDDVKLYADVLENKDDLNGDGEVNEADQTLKDQVISEAIGDVNGDNTINDADVEAVNNVLSDVEDVNDDGVVDNTDNNIKEYVMNNIVGDVNQDGKVDETDLNKYRTVIADNWYQTLLNGEELDNAVTIDKWFDNLSNGVYGNGMGSLISLRLAYNARIKFFANLRASKSKFYLSGKALSESDIEEGIEGPNSIVDPSTDPESPYYKWYHGTDFATNDFENSDENGDSEWQ